MPGKVSAQKKVMSGLFWVYLENISGQVVSLIVTIILARLLTPSDYGVVALLSVFISLAQVFVTSGVTSALIQKKDADELDYSTMFWFNFVISIFLYFLLFFTSPLIGNYYNNSDLIIVLRIMALSIPLSAYNCIQQAYVASHMVFKKSFVSNFGGTIISGVVGISMAICGLGLWALVTQRILFVAVNTIMMRFVVDWVPKLIFSLVRLRPMISFGWKMMVTGFMFTGYTELRSLIIGKRYSAADLGYYDRGFSFPKLIASNIDSTIGRVLFPALSQEQEALGNLSDKTRRAAKTSAYIMTPILWLLALIAQPLVLLLLGEKWLPCVPFMQIMCFAWWLQPTQSCSAQAIKAIGRSDIYLYIEIVSKIIGLLLLAYAVLVADSVLAIAIMLLVGQAIAVYLYGWCSSRFIGYRLYNQFKDLSLPALLSAIACIVAHYSTILIENTLVVIFLQGVIVFSLYLIQSVLFKIESYRYLRSLLTGIRANSFI